MSAEQVKVYEYDIYLLLIETTIQFFFTSLAFSFNLVFNLKHMDLLRIWSVLEFSVLSISRPSLLFGLLMSS